MILDAFRRFLGLERNSSRIQDEPSSPALPHGDDRLVPFREQIPPDMNEIESEFAHVHEFMEQQMRAMMGSFGFMFGSPFAGFGFGDDFGTHPNRSFPFTPDFRELPDNSLIPESPKTGAPALDPRDEVLKPQFRTKSSNQWNGQDQILDGRVEAEGPSSIIDILKPSNRDQERHDFPSDSLLDLFGTGPFNPGNLFGFRSAPDSGSVMSSSTVTIYSNVNGHKTVEKIIRHPDGKVERTVISDDGHP